MSTHLQEDHSLVHLQRIGDRMKETYQGAFQYKWGFTKHIDCGKRATEVVRFDSIICQEPCLAAYICDHCGVYATYNDRLFKTPTTLSGYKPQKTMDSKEMI